jgi:hypothetical protein
MRTIATRTALIALGLATLAAPHFAQPAFAQSTVYVRPGYGFNGALERTEAQTAAPGYVGQGYTYTPQGYVHTAPAYPAPTYNTVPTYTGPIYTGPTYATPAPAYAAPAYSAPPSVASAPILDRDTIEDRLDDQGYDDIKVGELHGTYYSVRAEDREDRKVWLKVDATTGYVLESQFRRN